MAIVLASVDKKTIENSLRIEQVLVSIEL